MPLYECLTTVRQFTVVRGDNVVIRRHIYLDILVIGGVFNMPIHPMHLRRFLASILCHITPSPVTS